MKFFYCTYIKIVYSYTIRTVLNKFTNYLGWHIPVGLLNINEYCNQSTERCIQEEYCLNISSKMTRHHQAYSIFALHVYFSL